MASTRDKMRTRASIKFDRNWIDRAENGVPFDLVESGSESAPEKAEARADGRRARVSQRTRRLREMGELMTVQEVASRLKCNIDYVYELVTAGQLKKTPIGKRQFRIAMADLED